MFSSEILMAEKCNNYLRTIPESLLEVDAFLCLSRFLVSIFVSPAIFVSIDERKSPSSSSDE